MDTKEFLGIRLDNLSFEEALTTIQAQQASGAFRYVVTPNVDHIVRIEEMGDPEVAAAYRTADLCLCDSQVLRLLARPFGIRLSTITGSDLVLKLIPGLIRPGETINLIGGDAEIAARLQQILPDTRITTHYPPMGMIDDPAAMQAAVDFLKANPAEYSLLCCGSPQQELVAYRTKLSGGVSGTALCIGAAVEFLVERKQRAPLVMRRMGLEWLHRLFSEPRRLWKRYLIRSPRIIPIVIKWGFMRQVRKK